MKRVENPTCLGCGRGVMIVVYVDETDTPRRRKRVAILCEDCLHKEDGP